MELNELYIAPEAEIIGFKPMERLALDGITLGGEFTGNGPISNFDGNENPDMDGEA